MKSHFIHMVLFSAIVSTFFAFLTRQQPRARFRLGLVLACAMIGASLVLAWVMFPFPAR